MHPSITHISSYRSDMVCTQARNFLQKQKIRWLNSFLKNPFILNSRSFQHGRAIWINNHTSKTNIILYLVYNDIYQDSSVMSVVKVSRCKMLNMHADEGYPEINSSTMVQRQFSLKEPKYIAYLWTWRRYNFSQESSIYYIRPRDQILLQAELSVFPGAKRKHILRIKSHDVPQATY